MGTSMDNPVQCVILDDGLTYTAAGYAPLCEIAYSNGVLKARGIRFDVVYEHSEIIFSRDFEFKSVAEIIKVENTKARRED
jgi:hypothetical protein